ncbi:MAG: hypothetical protein FJW38_28640 [Acidobacteria bacterium]|nr:hypothetical protein [Acidobacteriota bacterium]
MPPLAAPLRTDGARILDSAGAPVVLRGVAGNIDAFDARTLGVLRIRWNLNTVRVPADIASWKRDGDAYLDRLLTFAQQADRAGMAVVFAAQDVAPMPNADTLAFWRAAAAKLKDLNRAIFSLYRQPSGTRDWAVWRTSMQQLADAVRAAGARQLIAVSAFNDAQGFAGIPDDVRIAGGNVLYEAPFHYSFGGDPKPFGALGGKVPLYAGEWGIDLSTSGPACANLPKTANGLNDLLIATAFQFSEQAISATIAPFRVGGLVREFEDYLPTSINRAITCGDTAAPAQGMGEVLLLWLTGDLTGFGYMRDDRVANAAGGPAAPIAPGELISIYTEQLGPERGLSATLDATGRIPTELGGTRVLINGAPVPLLFASAFQINAQVPYDVQPGTRVTMQVLFNGVPSNRAQIEVVNAAPEIFIDPNGRIAVALNQDGTRNGAGNPALPGTVITFFATGSGQTSPPGRAGVPVEGSHPALVEPVNIVIGGRRADVFFSGEVPGFIGLNQFNVRLADAPVGGERTSLMTLTVGNRFSRSPAFLYMR